MQIGIHEKVQDISQQVFELVSKTHDQKNQDILRWLSSSDYHPQQNDFIRKQEEGTGKWLLDSEKFQQWQKGEKQVLFCPGIPGAGKTMITSTVVDHLMKVYRNDVTVGIAFVYYNFRRQHEQRPIDILSSLLEQFSRQLPSLPECVIELHETHNNKEKKLSTQPSTTEISSTLQNVIKEYSRTFVIIDALDEYEADRFTLLSELFEIQKKANFNLLTTSRPLPDIERYIGRLFVRSTYLKIQTLPEDVKKYIDANLHKLPLFVSHDHDLINEIKNEIVRAAGGM
jgi:Cdc6-like AAA superfamily ATPase